MRIIPTIIQICGNLFTFIVCFQHMFKMFNNLKLINFISSQLKKTTTTTPISVMRIMLNNGSIISQVSNWLTGGIQHSWLQPSGGSEGTAGGPQDVT